MKVKILSVFTVIALLVACENPFVMGILPDVNNGNETTYTVTFDKNHQDATEANPRTMTVSPGNSVGTLPTAPERTGYKFVHWTMNKDGTGGAFTAATAVNDNITVYARWRQDDETGVTIILNITGSVSGDSVTVSPEEGEAGDTITISYTLANDKRNNRLVFSGTKANIAQVDVPETGTREYVVDEDDADLNGIITINATFTHTDKELDEIAFAENVINKTYGNAPFIITVSSPGQGTGAITYSSSDTSIATVNSGTGQVTIVKAGSVTITATKAADETYEGTTADYTLHIAKAAGGTVSAPTQQSVTSNSITVNTVSAPSTGQTVEYGLSTTTSEPEEEDWQDGTHFTGLTANTNYYIFARAKENGNYNAGPAARSAQIKTDSSTQPPGEIIPAEIVDFESDAVGKTYESTKGGSSPTVAVVADPVHAGEKSLRVNSTDYNQAAIVPINLPYALQSYENVTFRFNYASGSLTNQEILVYAAKSTGTFAQYGFGNPADSQYAQFAANLVGTASPDYSKTNQWQNFSITITNPGSAIRDIKGDIYLAIGINHNSNITYLLDDITFNIKDDFEPPPPPPPGPTPPSVGAVTSGNYRNLFKELGKTDQEIDAKVNAAYNQLFVNGTADQKIYYEVAPDMAYVLDSGNDDVRSEGMSYGMMMAVQMNDQTRFDKLWKWAHTYMYNDRTVANIGKNIRGFFKWQVKTNGTHIDDGTAADGEFYFVTALLFAENRWGNGSGIYEYGKYARFVLYDMLNRKGTDPDRLDNYGAIPMFNATHNVPEFTTISAQHTDPSYILPAFYDVWAMEIRAGTQYHNSIWGSQAAANADAARYEALATAGREFFPKTVNATTGLGPDYAQYNGSPKVEAGHEDFRYDAWRIAMNIGMDYSWWAKDSWQITQSNRIQTFFHGKGVDTYGSLWNLNGNGPLQNGADHSPGLVACNAVASLAATQAITWDFIQNFWEISTTEGQYRYYDGCLYMMGLLHVSGKFKAYLSNGSTPPTPSPSINPTSATFDKNAPTDIAVTMTLNGSTLSNIKNGSTTLTQGNNTYTVSGSNVAIKAAYLAAQAVGTTTLTFTFSNGTTRSLTITISDSTPTPDISPTTATFDKKTEAQADIVVTMTLLGQTLSSITGGSPAITSSGYTLSGSTVTIKKEYLAGQANGQTVLTFTFSGGGTRTLTITVGDTTGGGPIGGLLLAYDFSSNPGAVWEYAPAGSVSAEWKNENGGSPQSLGVLEVQLLQRLDNNSGVLILPFNLGNTKLKDYASIKIEMAAIAGGSNDSTHKSFGIEVSTTGTFGRMGTNTKIVANASGTAGNNEWNSRTFNLTLDSVTEELTGTVKIAFGIPAYFNPTAYYRIKRIELVPKP